MKYSAILLAATILHAAPAFAVIDPPAASKEDARIRTVIYDAKNTVQIYAAPGSTFRLQFGDDETVLRVVASDQDIILPNEDAPAANSPAAANMVASSNATFSSPPPGPTAKMPVSCDIDLCHTIVGNFVYLKANRELSPQPLFVQSKRTLENGEIKMIPYTFELLTRPGDLTEKTPHTVFAISFSYPDRDKAAQIAAWRARQAVRDAAERERAALAPPPPTTMAATANRRYGYRGPADIVPDATWDDGRTTFMRFSGNRRIPNIYRRLPDGSKAVPAYAIEPDATGNTLRIALTETKWWIEDGDKTACIFNLGSDPEGRTSTTVAQVGAAR